MSEKITFYKDQWAFIGALSDEEAGRLLKAAFEYSRETTPDEVFKKYIEGSDRFLVSAWEQTREKIDFSIKQSEQKSEEQRRKAMIRWEKQKNKDAAACHGINGNAEKATAESAIPAMPTYTNTNTYTNNKRHTVGKNGKTYRILDDGVAYYWDDNSPVKEGESVG